MYSGTGSDANEEARKRKGVDRQTLRRAWDFGRPYRKLLAIYMATAIAVAVIGVLPPVLFKRLVDTSIPNKDLNSINLLSAIAVGVALLIAALGLMIRWIGARIGEGIIYDLRCALFDQVQRMPIAFFTRTQTGSLMSRLNNDVVGAQQAFTSTLRNTVNDLLVVVSTLVAMTIMSWRLTLLSLAVVPFLFWMAKGVGVAMQRATRTQMDENAKLNSMMTERFNVSGAMLVKLFGNASAESTAFASVASRVRNAGVKRAMTGVVFYIVLPLIGALGTASVYWFGARQVIDGSITIGKVLGMSLYVQRLYQPLTELASSRIDFLTAIVSFERVFEVLDAPTMIKEPITPEELPVNERKIEFKNVSFKYPAAKDFTVKSLESEGASSAASDESDWILRDVSFVAERGTMTALVGPSGAGKSTLISLISRLYDVTEGAVFVNDTDVRNVRLGDLSSRIGVVSQDSHLFHDSIVNNLRYARPGASDEEVVDACKAARIHELIAGLPGGYATTVGERGYRLSGGEKQRVAIARMLLKNPEIVILDEATAHLDSETESLIQLALSEALRGRTSIVIAHRLSTIQSADQILVVEAGKIVERGTHRELLNLGGLYSELHATQFANAE